MRKIIISTALALLALPASAQAYSLHSYRVRDAGSTIRHSLTICEDQYDLVHRFELATRVERSDGTDKRFRYSRYTVFGCQRVTQWYRDVLKYEGWYYGRVKVTLLQTDDIQFTRWRRFWSS